MLTKDEIQKEISTLVYDIRNTKIGYIHIELYNAFENHILKLYELRAKNYVTMEALIIEKFYINDEEATEQLSKYAESILGFTREEMRNDH